MYKKTQNTHSPRNSTESQVASLISSRLTAEPTLFVFSFLEV